MKPNPVAHEIPIRFEANPGPPEALRARIFAEIAAQPAPGMQRKRRWVVATLVLLGIPALVLGGRYIWFGRAPLRADLGGLTVPSAISSLAGTIVLFGALVAVSTFMAVRAGRYGLGAAARALAFTCATVAPAYAVLALALPLECAATRAAEASVHPLGLPCFAVAALIGSLALATLTWSLRGAAPVSSRLRGAALGAASGAWAGFALVLHCPSGSPVHVLVGHALPIAIFTAAGAVVAPRYLRP